MTAVPPTHPPAAPEGDVSALREALAAATPVGEWRAVEGDLEGKPASEYARTLFANRENDGTTTGRLFLTVAPNPIDPENGATVVPALTGDGPQSQANAELIALAVNALPSLLADLDALRERVRVVEGERDEYKRGWVEADVSADYATARAESAEAALAELRAGVEALHRPIRVYDECEHDADHGCEPIEVYDYQGCSESMIGWGCSVCCYDDEYPREDCPHGADHLGVSREQSCPTHALLGGAS